MSNDGIYFLNRPVPAPRDNLDLLHAMFYDSKFTEYKPRFVHIYCELYALRRLAETARKVYGFLPTEEAVQLRDALEYVERSCLELSPPPPPPEAA